MLSLKRQSKLPQPFEGQVDTFLVLSHHGALNEARAGKRAPIEAAAATPWGTGGIAARRRNGANSAGQELVAVGSSA